MKQDYLISLIKEQGYVVYDGTFHCFLNYVEKYERIKFTPNEILDWQEAFKDEYINDAIDLLQSGKKASELDLEIRKELHDGVRRITLFGQIEIAIQYATEAILAYELSQQNNTELNIEHCFKSINSAFYYAGMCEASLSIIENKQDIDEEYQAAVRSMTAGKGGYTKHANEKKRKEEREEKILSLLEELRLKNPRTKLRTLQAKDYIFEKVNREIDYDEIGKVIKPYLNLSK